MEKQKVSGAEAPALKNRYRQRMITNFSVFGVFFIFYMGVAIINTLPFKSIAALPAFGIPLGLFLSLLIFPVSWLLIVVYFLIWR